jgi:hypothetical protein
MCDFQLATDTRMLNALANLLAGVHPAASASFRLPDGSAFDASLLDLSL